MGKLRILKKDSLINRETWKQMNLFLAPKNKEGIRGREQEITLHIKGGELRTENRGPGSLWLSIPHFLAGPCQDRASSP